MNIIPNKSLKLLLNPNYISILNVAEKPTHLNQFPVQPVKDMDTKRKQCLCREFWQISKQKKREKEKEYFVYKSW